MSVSSIVPQPQPSVEFNGDSLLINDFIVTSPEVVEGVRAAEDPVAAVHVRLELGAKVFRLATATVDTEAVKG